MTGDPPAQVIGPPPAAPRAVPSPAPQDVAAPAAPARPMRRWRVGMVYAVLTFIVLGHLFEVVTQHENWPFSPYQMWSIASTSWVMSEDRVLGVTDEPTPREVSMEDPAYLAPLPNRFVSNQLRYEVPEALKGKPQRLHAIVWDYLNRYEQRRKAGLHHGPPLRGVRLYKYSWVMTRDASNRDAPTRELLFETDGAKGVQTTTDTTSAPKGRESGNVDPE